MPAERLQKVLASAGVASRRASEALIAEGRVTVDGKVATVGDQVDPERSIITVDGRVIGGAGALAYLLLHKPDGRHVDDPRQARAARPCWTCCRRPWSPKGRGSIPSAGSTRIPRGCSC